MILLDTHIWVWWIHSDTRLTDSHLKWLSENESQGLGVSMISIWEVAKLVEYNRLILPCPVANWFEQALLYPGIALINITVQIALESTQLPGKFHRDPADQMIVATARIYDCPLLTADAKILNYPHVKILK